MLDFMATLGDYVLEGGIKGKRFADPVDLRSCPVVIYEVDGTNVVDRTEGIEGSPFMRVVGRILSPESRNGRPYSNTLINCLDHKEFEDS